MAAIGGDILELAFNHPNIGSGTLYPKAGEDSTFSLGGFRGDDEMNGIDGSGAVIRKITRSRWSCEVTLGWDNNTRLDLEKVNQLAGDVAEAEWTISHVSGTVYRGTGTPVGDINGSGNSATIKLKISGGGNLKKI